MPEPIAPPPTTDTFEIERFPTDHNKAFLIIVVVEVLNIFSICQQKSKVHTNSHTTGFSLGMYKKSHAFTFHAFSIFNPLYFRYSWHLHVILDSLVTHFHKLVFGNN